MSFAVRTAAQICDATDAERAGDWESQLQQIADIKNCDIEDVREWERGIMEEARSYAERLINAAVAKGAAEVMHLETARRLQIVEAQDYAGGYDDEQQSWLIDQLIPARGIGMVWGASGSHKTGVALDLLAAVHSGAESWRGKAVTRGRGVLVLAEGQHFFRDRLRAYSKRHNVAMSAMPAVVLSPVNLRDNKQVAILAHELLKLGASQVWFDTLQQNSAGADGNSDRDMGEVISNLKWLSDKIGGFCGVLHHEGKSGHDRGPRGSSVWRPALDVELYVESPDGVAGTIRVEKLKDGPPSSVYPFKREIVGLDRHENGRPVTSIVVVHTDDAPVAKTGKLPQMGTLPRSIYDKAITLGGPEVDALREAVIANMTEPEDGKPDRRGSRFNEALDKLLHLKLLFKVDGRVSHTQIVKGGAGEAF